MQLSSLWSRSSAASQVRAPLAGKGALAHSKGKSAWRRRLPHLVGLCLLSIAICSSLDLPQASGRSSSALAALSYFEQYAYSVRMLMFGAQREDLVEKARNKIVLITTSNDTFSQIPGPPVPRRYHADIVNQLTKAGAKVIAFDFLFDQPHADAQEDNLAFAEAAKQSGRVLWASSTNNMDKDHPVFIHALPMFRQASPYEGYINAGDSTLRQLEQPILDHLKLSALDNGKTVPAFSLMAARMATDKTNQPLENAPILGGSGTTKIPTDENGDFRITFLGGANRVFPEIPYEVISRGETQNEFYTSYKFFKDKIVLVGDDTSFGNDYHYTPIGQMTGVEIHAHAIATLLLGCFIREAPSWVNLALIGLMGAIVCPLAAMRKIQWLVLTVVAILLAYFFLNVWLFISYGWWLHLIGPSASLLLATVFVLIERGLFEEREKEHMFDALVTAAGTAIEKRDPTTSGHSERVTDLTIALAEAVTKQKTGPFKDVRFSPSQLKELRYAGLLHDFGKIGVRENVLVKSHKLDPKHFEAVVSRLLIARQALALDYSQRQIKALQNKDESFFSIDTLEQDLNSKLAQIDSDITLLEKSNDPMVTYLPDAQYEQLQELLDRLEAMSYQNVAGNMAPIITIEERNALSIRKGSLTPAEYREVQKHAALSFDFLEQIPWTDSLSNIPEIARAHHEKLNGKGYPRGLTAEQIPLQARMMTIADIYDALTAADRPYKKAMSLDKALQILRGEAQDGALDLDLLEIFIEQRVYAVTEDWKYTSQSKIEAITGPPAYAA